jgi:hypothetical protein
MVLGFRRPLAHRTIVEVILALIIGLLGVWIAT